MKNFLIFKGLTVLGAVTSGSAAFAHGGHVAEAGHGHSHWLAVAAIGAIAAIGLGLLYKRVRNRRQREIHAK